MRFAFIDSEKAAYPLRLLCRVLQVSKSGYYAWLRRGPSDRALEDEQLRPKVVEAFGRGRGTYGSVRVRREIVAQGFEIGRRRVVRLMGEMGLAGLPARKFQVTTDSNHAQPIAANVLNRDFVATRPNKKWVTDITYVWTGEGWLYLAAVLDLYSRRVVGWSTGATLETTLCLKALSTALGHRGKVRGLLHHSDRGTQYASDDYQAALKARGITCSMSRRGNCYDNAVMEAFFSTVKNEVGERYESHGEAKGQLFDYIEVFYNQRRRHSSAGRMSPAAFERRMAQAA